MRTIGLLWLLSCLSQVSYAAHAKLTWENNEPCIREISRSTAPQCRFYIVDRTIRSRQDSLVTITIQNNTPTTRTVSLRFTKPGSAVYSVVSTTLEAYAKQSETYPIGTKIEQLNAQQQAMAMTGATVVGTIIGILTAEDNGRTFPLTN